MMRILSLCFISTLSTTLAAGCVLNPKEVGEFTATDASTTNPPSSGTSTEPVEPSTSSPGDGTSTEPVEPSTSSPPDGTSTEPVEPSTSGGPDGPLHAACELPFPEPAPALPPINMGPDDTPKFDDWTDLACESLADLTCDAQCGRCLRGVEDGPGVCSFSDADIWCDGDGEAVGYGGEDACYICSPPEVRAFACCNFPEGFDCRVWPYPSDGPPGSICARHEDCEPGLVCGPHRGTGYGVCQCPGIADPDTVTPPESCFN
ncbi:hypothetical protein [Nannocystis sp. SCPEA4]|uniref:hypothetical protein n=1 Tax=Nannocystis sp. SCPEA4 TaxID=2996787 RepID=UPI0022714EB1|nr:hypothetical protein [Nannocystis sp. SCPEA4]MCY1056556.1 hypothetical protein [Nannocystis sp. SCPEA4]